MINTPSYKRCYLKTKSGCLTVSRKINTEVSKKIAEPFIIISLQNVEPICKC